MTLVIGSAHAQTDSFDFCIHVLVFSCVCGVYVDTQTCTSKSNGIWNLFPSSASQDVMSVLVVFTGCRINNHMLEFHPSRHTS